ncbi:MAG: ubiquitin-conjugating enzyme E2 [Amphiamblys sp. WSBS2006]|nr:MAG: ubiquitin-conjugating enzyme E2 [Amphiamblys sp. WSBS2006]
MEGRKQRRVQKEIKRMKDDSSGDVKEVFFIEENRYAVVFSGPQDTPYENREIKLFVDFAEGYPFEPPGVRLQRGIYHPNIDDQGRVCLDLLKTYPSGTWRPHIGLEAVVQSIRLLLAMPNTADPLVAEIAREYDSARETFNRKARERLSDARSFLLE